MLALRQLEQALADPDEVLIATADLEVGLAQLAQQQSELGLKLFGHAGSGYTRDTSLTDADRGYTTFDLRAGLRYPLLGRAAAEQRGLIEAETAVKEKEQRLQLARVQSLAALRRQYLVYWGAQEKLILTRSFLAGEDQTSALLAQRRQAGYLLASDQLEFLTAFDLARRNQESLRATQQKALRTLQRLSPTVSSPFLAQPPELPLPCQDPDKLKTAVTEQYPTISLLRLRLAGLQRQAPLTRADSVDANVDLFTAAGNDDFQTNPEYSIGVNIAVQLPVGRLRHHQAPLREVWRALIEKARHEMALESSNTCALAEEALALYRAAQADLLLANRRLQAAIENVRENTLRAAYLEGDTLERLQQSRYGYYQAALDYIDSQTRRWNLQVSLLEYAPEGCNTDNSLGDKDTFPAGLAGSNGTDAPPHGVRSTASQPGIDSFYVWNAHALRKQSDIEAGFWRRLRSAGVRRLLLSLNSTEIAELAQPAARSVFRAWLENARAEGLAMELLLGEPLWILPQYRGTLRDLVASLADLPFSGLHLDLEPHQLGMTQGEIEKLRVEWLESVKAAGAVSPWPLGVSLHPRYLQPDGPWPGLGADLSLIGVREIALMIYNSNPERVMAIAIPILETNAGLCFSIAQSVEPQLTEQESHHLAGRELFDARMALLASRLERPNFSGILVQAWDHWQELAP
jgi:outer membrane protein TolC